MPEGLPKGLFSHLLLFARRLKEQGFKITPARVTEAVRSLAVLDLSRRDDFFTALRANFVSSQNDLAVFAAIFAEFWHLPEETYGPARTSRTGEEEGDTGPEELAETISIMEMENPEDRTDKTGELRTGYSPQEVLADKSFSQLDRQEWEILGKEFARLLEKLTRITSRRRRPAARGRELDFRHSLKRSARYGGELVELIRRRRKTKPLHLSVICDVSGSMDAATRFILFFLFGMQKVFPKGEFFVFSTRLTRITDILKRNRWAGALADISRRARDWSGGTRIGACLKTFNERYARERGSGSAAVILISDGWDRGEPEILEAEMKRLRRTAKRLIWMNPLLGSPDYQPLCRGMRTALPYVDYFLPADSLKGWQSLVQALTSLPSP